MNDYFYVTGTGSTSSFGNYENGIKACERRGAKAMKLESIEQLKCIEEGFPAIFETDRVIFGAKNGRWVEDNSKVGPMSDGVHPYCARSTGEAGGRCGWANYGSFGNDHSGKIGTDRQGCLDGANCGQYYYKGYGDHLNVKVGVVCRKQLHNKNEPNVIYSRTRTCGQYDMKNYFYLTGTGSKSSFGNYDNALNACEQRGARAMKLESVKLWECIEEGFPAIFDADRVIFGAKNGRWVEDNSKVGRMSDGVHPYCTKDTGEAGSRCGWANYGSFGNAHSGKVGTDRRGCLDGANCGQYYYKGYGEHKNVKVGVVCKNLY